MRTDDRTDDKAGTGAGAGAGVATPAPAPAPGSVAETTAPPPPLPPGAAGERDRGGLVGDLARRLREAILSGDLAEGTPLRQDALARRFSVSRIPVREALRQLEAEGLVLIQAHRGARVAGLSVAEITEIFEIRAVLEPHLLRLSLPRMGPRDLAAAGTLLDAYEDALDRGDAARWGDLNWAFHQAFLIPAERPRTLEIIEGLRRRVDRYTRLQITLTDGGAIARRDHREILALARAGAVDACAQAVARHIRTAAADLTDRLVREPTPEAPALPESS